MTNQWVRSLVLSGLVVLPLCVATTGVVVGQGVAPSLSRNEEADDAAFKDFLVRVQAYVKVQKVVESGLPSLKTTDLPEMIAAHQHALARKIKEARPNAKAGDIFTLAACDAFRRASKAALDGPQTTAQSRAYMQPDAPNPKMKLEVNGTYPDTEPTTALSPELLAAFPPLPTDVTYRVVGRTLMLIDIRSSLIIDICLLILPPVS